MSSEDSVPFEFVCKASGMNGPQWHATVEFQFDEVVADHVAMWTRLRIDRSVYETGRWFYWWNIRNFADGLATLHTELTGSSSLSDWDGETILCISGVDSKRGQVGVGGQLNQFAFVENAVPKGDLVFPSVFGGHGGIVIAFDGLEMDLMYVPRLVKRFRAFLDDSGITHRPPWP